jgi:hypothetical protein
MPVSAGSSSCIAPETTRERLRAVNEQANRLAASADAALEDFD